MKLFTVAAIQMCSGITLEKNLCRAQELIDQAAAKGAKLILLPEYFCLMGNNELDKVMIAEPLGNGPIQTMLANTAKKNKIWLIGGTAPLISENNTQKVRNTSLVYSPDGDLVQHYDKIHLFSYQGEQENFDEARTIVAGQQTATCFINTAYVQDLRKTALARRTDEDSTQIVRQGGLSREFEQHAASLRNGLRLQAQTRPARATQPGQFCVNHNEVLHIGLSICYDLRFPELYRQMGISNPLDLIVVPAAFTYSTGQAHWEVLLRARAIENQCYVLAAAQGGIHENGRRTWGHSLLIDPWGKILAQLENDEGIVSGNIDLKHIAVIRKNLPALKHKVL